MSARLLLPILLAGAMTAAAQAAEPPLADPTQPPAGMLAADGSLAGGAAPGLTSVFLPQHGRPQAIIDGQLVALGGTVRGARLTFVSEKSVVLESAGGIERLYLTPDVAKKTTATTETKAKRAARRQRTE